MQWWRNLKWKWHLAGCKQCWFIVEHMLPPRLLCMEGFDIARAARPTPKKEDPRG